MDARYDKLGFLAIAVAAVISAFGWFAADRWLESTDSGSSILLAVLRTIFALFPAIVGFLIANRRQRQSHRIIAGRLQELRDSLTEFHRIRRIEHELHTMDRLSKVAKEAVKNTASSARELFGAIEAVDDPRVKERLVERYRSHTNNVVTVLSAVSEQLEDSGRAIQRELTAEEQIHILEREQMNSAKGIAHAREMMEQRGIADGLQQLNVAAAQAAQLQLELSSFKSLGLEGPTNGQD